MRKVAGIDSSTQATKVVVCDADDGRVVAEQRAPHPEGTEVEPRFWWEALQSAAGELLSDVDAVAVAGQQHGMVALDDTGQVVRPALLWNDTRSAQAATDLIAEGGGPKAWADAVGLVPVASFTVTKLRWLAEHEPHNAERVAAVALPHDWVTALLRGDNDLTTDRGDASGTGYWSPITGEYRPDLLKLAFGRVVDVPRVLGPSDSAGSMPSGATLAPGTGDNMAGALGVGAEKGDVVVSIGTSGTAFAVSDSPTTDTSGTVAGFADATGRYLPLVATLNAARVLTATAAMLDVDVEELDRLALTADAGAGGLVLLPYLDGERTPNLPSAAGSLHGMRRGNMTPANVARAAVEGLLCSLADGIAAVTNLGVPVRRALLIGGGARSAAVQHLAPSVLGVPVVIPPPAEYVALGAARQAAWVLEGGDKPPQWELEGSVVRDDVATDVGNVIRGAYAETRRAAYGV